MENLLDLLVPLIFVLSFALNGLFKSKKDKDKDPKQTAPGDGDDQEKDIFQELKEEIRRKVAENQRNYDPNRPETEQAKPLPLFRQSNSDSLEEQKRRLSTGRTPSQSTETYDRVNREVSERMQNMKRMQDQVEAMKKKAAAEKRKAADVLSKHSGGASYGRKRRRSIGSRGVVGEVISELKQPNSSRKAILNSEILGMPVGLKKPSQSSAQWEN